MAWIIRVMRREDQAAVCRLLARQWGGDSVSNLAGWHDTLEWLYFSPDLPDPAPRAFVIADDRTVVGHVGLTISELRCADLAVRVVHTLNWIVDPDYKLGMLALRLMTTAEALGDVALVIGGGPLTHQMVPALGFKYVFEMDRRIKVLAPLGFLGTAQTPRQLVRKGARLASYSAQRCRGALTTHAERRPDNVLSFELLEEPPRDSATSASGNERVLRNTVPAAFLNWYRQCPRGHVQFLRCLDEGAVVGHATVLVQPRGRRRLATIAHADVVKSEQGAWDALLGGVEKFLRRQEVTHVMTTSTYKPWSQALEARGHYKVRGIPLRLHDRDGKLAGVRDWHITPIEGDLGYLLG